MTATLRRRTAAEALGTFAVVFAGGGPAADQHGRGEHPRSAPAHHRPAEVPDGDRAVRLPA
jgi:hypothetical protein